MSHHDPYAAPSQRDPRQNPQQASPGGYPPPGPHPNGPGAYAAQPGAPWPGYGPYGPAPSVPSGLATASVVLAAVVTVVQLLGWLLSFSAAEEFRAAAEAGWAPWDVYTTYDSVSFFYVPALLAAGVVSIVWLWKSRVLADTLSPSWRHARSRVWVWLGWFVPVVALWFPYQVVRDVRRATVRAPRPGLGWWWAGWLVLGFASNAASRIPLSTSTDPSVAGALPFFETVATVATVVALVLWIRTVREITAAQRELLGAPPAHG